MANQIIPKRSSVAAKVPLAADLQVGELAINLADGLIFSKNAAGTVITLGGSGAGDSLPAQTGNGGKFLTTDGTAASWATPAFLALTGGTLTGNLTITSSALTLNGTLGTTQVNAFGDQLSFSKNGYNYLTASGASAILQIQASGASGKIILATAGNDRITVSPDGNVTLAGPTSVTGALSATGGFTDAIFAVTGTTPALSPSNGSIQTWAMTAASTPTLGTWVNGQSMTLMIEDGSAYAITWTSLSITWKTDSGSAPTLNTAGYTVIELWKVGGVLYGARVGNA